MNSNYPSTNDIIENLNTLLDNLKFPNEGSINEFIKISKIRTDSTEGTKADINIKDINKEMSSVILYNFSQLISAVGNCKGDTSKDGPKNLPLWTNLGVITSNLELLLNRMNKWKDDNKDDNKDDTSVGISTITNSTNSTNSKSKSVETPIVENILESINADNDTITLKYNDSYEEHLKNSGSDDATTIVTIKKKRKEDKTHLHELSVNTFKNDAPSNHFENGKRGFIKKYLMPLYDDDYFKVKNPYAALDPKISQKEIKKEGLLDYLNSKWNSDTFQKPYPAQKKLENIEKELTRLMKLIIKKNIESLKSSKEKVDNSINFFTKFPSLVIEDEDIKSQASDSFKEKDKKNIEIIRIKDKLQKAIDVHKNLTEELKKDNLKEEDNYKDQEDNSKKFEDQKKNKETELYILPLNYENGKHSIYKYDKETKDKKEDIETKDKKEDIEKKIDEFLIAEFLEKGYVEMQLSKLRTERDQKPGFFEKYQEKDKNNQEESINEFFKNNIKSIEADDKNELYYVYYFHKKTIEYLKNLIFKEKEERYNIINNRLAFTTILRYYDKIFGFIPQKVYGCLVVPDENYYYNLLSVDGAIKNIDKFFPKIDDYDPHNMEPEKFLKYIQINLFPNCSSTKEKQLNFTDIEKYLKANGSLPEYNAAKTKDEKKEILEKILPSKSYIGIEIIEPECDVDIKESYYNDVITIELSNDRDNYFDFCNSLDDILKDKLYLFKQSIDEKINNFEESPKTIAAQDEASIQDDISEIQLLICYFVINIAMTMIFIRSCLDEKYNNTSENGKYKISKEGEEIINKNRFYRGETIWRDEEIEEKYSKNQGTGTFSSLSTNYLQKNNQLFKDLRSKFNTINNHNLLKDKMKLKEKKNSDGTIIREPIEKTICSYILSEVNKIVVKYFKYNDDKYVANEEDAKVYQTIFDNLGNNYRQSFHQLILSYTLEIMFWLFEDEKIGDVLKNEMFKTKGKDMVVKDKKYDIMIPGDARQIFNNHARLYLSNDVVLKQYYSFSKDKGTGTDKLKTYINLFVSDNNKLNYIKKSVRKEDSGQRQKLQRQKK